MFGGRSEARKKRLRKGSRTHTPRAFWPRPDTIDVSYRSLDEVGCRFSGRGSFDLSEANLFSADLTAADLSSALLRDGNLEAVVWRDAVCPFGFLADAGAEACAVEPSATLRVTSTTRRPPLPIRFR